MRLPVLLKQSTYHTFRTRTPLSFEVKKIFKALLVTLFLFLLGSGVIFLLSRSESAQKGYLLRAAELQHASLQSHYQEMDQKVLNASSTKAILESDVVEDMEMPVEVRYLKK